MQGFNFSAHRILTVLKSPNNITSFRPRLFRSRVEKITGASQVYPPLPIHINSP